MFAAIFTLLGICVAPLENAYENKTPEFFCGSDAAETAIVHYQISTHSTFDDYVEGWAPFSECFRLQEYTTRELSEGSAYLRTQIGNGKSWSLWSDPCVFTYNSPTSYVQGRHVDDTTWTIVKPYLLPEQLPLKAKLDALFSASRVTLSLDSMKKAGFINPKPREWTRLIVTKHPDFPGYIFKIYLDAQRYHKNKPEYIQWIQRIKGVAAIQKEIDKRGWQNDFKTPKKWIYQLPDEPSPPKQFVRKNFILVEEDMDILDHDSNYSAWSVIPLELLNKLYVLLETVGLHDSKPDNIPYSQDGKLAFIDTQQINTWPVAYKKITPFFSGDLLSYWKELIKNARKKE